jgi:hypothetical protein
MLSSGQKKLNNHSAHKRGGRGIETNIRTSSDINQTLTHVYQDPYSATNCQTRSIAENLNYNEQLNHIQQNNTLVTPNSSYVATGGGGISNRMKRSSLSGLNRGSQYMNVLSLKNQGNAYFDSAMIIDDGNNGGALKSLNSSVDNNSIVRKSISANNSVAALGRLSVVSEMHRNNSKSFYRSNHKNNRLTNSMVMQDQDPSFLE